MSVSVITIFVQGRRAREEREFALKREQMADARKLRDGRLERLRRYYSAQLQGLYTLREDIYQLRNAVITGEEINVPALFRKQFDTTTKLITEHDFEPGTSDEFEAAAGAVRLSLAKYFTDLLKSYDKRMLVLPTAISDYEAMVSEALRNALEAARNDLSALETTDLSRFLGDDSSGVQLRGT